LAKLNCVNVACTRVSTAVMNCMSFDSKNIHKVDEQKLENLQCWWSQTQTHFASFDGWVSHG